ncbi:BsuPI-related putative proteinase inhibitor [Metabacillus arenae]|uniref:Proteinase inhibitor n=1 Tax=Metabacillus arenae TaxID=2771434 RepID=A0A926NM64_9BACI|nr:BsuPI-related putative proteinase inhibitor [Metabacillus arenae]MBD1380577.1 proteinase inhibitor [Metabacillus arenae]
MKKWFLFASFLFLFGCGQSEEEAKEVSGDVTKKEVQFSVNAKESSEYVDFDMKILNNTEEQINMEFRSGQKYEIRVLNESGKEVYRYSKGRMFTQAIQNQQLAPGEKQTYKEAWDYKNQENGSRVQAGTYTVQATFMGKIEGVNMNTLTAKDTFEVP